MQQRDSKQYGLFFYLVFSLVLFLQQACSVYKSEGRKRLEELGSSSSSSLSSFQINSKLSQSAHCQNQKSFQPTEDWQEVSSESASFEKAWTFETQNPIAQLQFMGQISSEEFILCQQSFSDNEELIEHKDEVLNALSGRAYELSSH